MSTVNEIFEEINKLITYNQNVTIISSHDEANIDKIKIKYGHVIEIRNQITEINKKAKQFKIRCELENNWDGEKNLYLFTVWYNGSIITVDNPVPGCSYEPKYESKYDKTLSLILNQ